MPAPILEIIESEPLFETRDLYRINGDGEEIRALDGINLNVDHGELIAVMGPSGSIKSTPLNMIGALDKPSSGMVLINGKDITKVRDIDEFRGKEVGFVFQLHNLIPTLTAIENVEIPMMGQMGSKARRIVTGGESELTALGITPAQIEAVQSMLIKANQEI